MAKRRKETSKSLAENQRGRKRCDTDPPSSGYKTSKSLWRILDLPFELNGRNLDRSLLKDMSTCPLSSERMEIRDFSQFV
ncbi:hypothetical protein PoB_003112300 [Plakobranchus ocellatus]|uniref:Uncharacterized protein n=1 Tax=Plakobranchus ocellatus TaxID=259542 RepID=A0AAV4ADI6_9GAST|nr:hypothetical protein PoB_003112300 [Plakobranchus ocellatus]